MQYLYLIKCQQFCKIGVASDVGSRLAQLSTGNPFNLEVLASYEFKNANAVEAVLHQKFEECWQRGEWYSLSDVQIGDAKMICLMLGGIANAEVPTVEEEEIEEAEALAEPTEGAKWDYAAMFSDGWRMEKNTNGRMTGKGSRYWCWRKGSESVGRKYMYGGAISDLPHPIEEMRRIYKPLAESVGNA